MDAVGGAARELAPVVVGHHRGDVVAEQIRLALLASLSAELAAWERIYTQIRHHQALWQRTPARYLASIGLDV